jgi:hypothetical protein
VALKRRVTEFSTTGVDEALQGFSSSPYPTRGTPSGFGLRIPGPISGSVQRYLFCLATFRTSGGRIRGIRQALTIGWANNNGATTTERPVEMLVRTPFFRFQNGNTSWHLVKEPQAPLVTKVPPTDTQSWSYQQARGPAMLYQTFTNTNVIPGTAAAGIGNGRPVLYDQALTAYTAPPVATNWTSIGGLGTFYDLRFPWDSDHAWNSVDIPIDGGWYSLYCSILQTDPATRIEAIYPIAPTSGDANANLDFGNAAPEESFIGNWEAADTEGVQNPGIIYWRVAGSLIVEDKAA